MCSGETIYTPVLMDGISVCADRYFCFYSLQDSTETEHQDNLPELIHIILVLEIATELKCV
jgi:hypothetical protein